MSYPNQSSQQLSLALEGDIQQLQSSYLFFDSAGSPSSITFSSQSMETPQFGPARKINKSINWSSCNTELNLAPITSTSTILQFQNLVSPDGNIIDGEAKPKEKAVLISRASEQNDIGHNGEQSNTMDKGPRPTQAQDHSMAERKRREKLSQRFIELSAIVPGLKKMDKTTILGDAINYVKELEEKVKCLETQNTNRNMESVVLVKKSQVIIDDDGSSSDDNFDHCATSKPLPEVEVKILDKTVLISILCDNQKGVICKVLAEVENLNLTISTATILPFSGSSIHFTITTQGEEGFSLTAKDLAKKLNSTFK